MDQVLLTNVLLLERPCLKCDEAEKLKAEKPNKTGTIQNSSSL